MLVWKGCGRNIGRFFGYPSEVAIPVIDSPLRRAPADELAHKLTLVSFAALTSHVAAESSRRLNLPKGLTAGDGEETYDQAGTHQAQIKPAVVDER